VPRAARAEKGAPHREQILELYASCDGTSRPPRPG
jgi:hypothetical protein